MVIYLYINLLCSASLIILLSFFILFVVSYTNFFQSLIIAKIFLLALS